MSCDARKSSAVRYTSAGYAMGNGYGPRNGLAAKASATEIAYAAGVDVQDFVMPANPPGRGGGGGGGSSGRGFKKSKMAAIAASV